MHDAKGRPLKVGDVVLIPVKMTHVSEGSEDYCNMGAESIFGRRPDALKETFSAINTAVVLRANEGDENDLKELQSL